MWFAFTPSLEKAFLRGDGLGVSYIELEWQPLLGEADVELYWMLRSSSHA